jgi:hypothetical protein
MALCATLLGNSHSNPYLGSSHPPSLKLVKNEAVYFQSLSDINKSKLLYKAFMALARQPLYETVRWHIIRREPIELYASFLNFLSHPVLVNIYTAKPSGKLWSILCHKPGCLLIIA